MKCKNTTPKRPVKFDPITVELVFETEDEIKALHEKLGTSTVAYELYKVVDDIYDELRLER